LREIVALEPNAAPRFKPCYPQSRFARPEESAPNFHGKRDTTWAEGEVRCTSALGLPRLSKDRHEARPTHPE